MVTITDNALERISDIVLGNVDDELHAVAVGIGTGNEAESADSLANEVYRSNKNYGDCYFEDIGSTGEFRAHLEVTAGGSTANVSVSNPTENEITEIGVFTKQGELIVIDEFVDTVVIPSGYTEEFTIDGDYTR